MDFDRITSAGWTTGKADPYVHMSVHADRVVRSSVKSRTLEPVWDEIYQFKVYELESESLTMEVYDKDDILHGGDDKIGTVTMPLSLLDANKCRVFEAQPLDMTGLPHARKQKHVQNPPTLRFELIYVPFAAAEAGEIAVPDDWEIPPSGVLKIRVMRSTKVRRLSAARATFFFPFLSFIFSI